MRLSDLLLPLRIDLPEAWGGMTFFGQLLATTLTVLANGAMWFFFATLLHIAITGEVAW